MWVISFTCRPLYPRGKNAFALHRRLGGPSTGLDVIIPALAGKRTRSWTPNLSKLSLLTILARNWCFSSATVYHFGFFLLEKNGLDVKLTTHLYVSLKSSLRISGVLAPLSLYAFIVCYRPFLWQSDSSVCCMRLPICFNENCGAADGHTSTDCMNIWFSTPLILICYQTES